MSKIDFRKQIQDLKKQKKMPTAELARQTGLSYFTVNNFLASKSNMTSDNLAKLFDALHSWN